MKTFLAWATQHLRPNRGTRQIQIEIPMKHRPQYKNMLGAGCRIEAEILSTGLVSLTIADRKEDIAIRIVVNGPLVSSAIKDMLIEEPWNKKKEMK